MIITEHVTVSWQPGNYKHYISKGYVFTKWGDKIQVKVSDLTKAANVHLEVKCESCSAVYNIANQAYSNRDNREDLCKECAKIKRTGYGTLPYHYQDWFRFKVKQWFNDSLKACNGKCVITGEKTKIVHHLYSLKKIIFETFAELKMDIKPDINNYTEEEKKLLADKCLELHYKHGLGVCLIKEIHLKFHSIYGTENTIPEQFCEFKNNC